MEYVCFYAFSVKCVKQSLPYVDVMSLYLTTVSSVIYLIHLDAILCGMCMQIYHMLILGSYPTLPYVVWCQSKSKTCNI